MKLVGVKEISELLGVKPSTLYQWAELKQMPHIKLNGCLRFDADEIEAWVISCKKDVRSEYNPIARTIQRPRKKGGQINGAV